jgi:WD40 repeat protein
LLTQGHTDSVNILILDHNVLFSASDDNTIKLWDCAAKMLLQTLELHKMRINLMILNEEMLISGSIDGMINIYNYTRQENVAKFKKKVISGSQQDDRIFSFAFSAASRPCS